MFSDKYVNCKLFLDSCPLWWYMVATHIKKIKHNMLCMTGVYFRDITSSVFVIVHLNVDRLSICSSCCGNNFFFSFFFYFHVTNKICSLVDQNSRLSS